MKKTKWKQTEDPIQQPQMSSQLAVSTNCHSCERGHLELSSFPNVLVDNM